MKKVRGWHIIDVPIYCGRIWVIFSKNFVKSAKKIGIDLPDNHYLGLAFRKKCKKGGQYCLMINRNTPGVIAHESLHIVHYILNDCGIKIDSENDEIQCYLLSWLIEKIEVCRNK